MSLELDTIERKKIEKLRRAERDMRIWVTVHVGRAGGEAGGYKGGHGEGRTDPLCQLPEAASPDRRLAGGVGPPARAGRLPEQGLLHLLQAPLLRHRQATQAQPTPRPGLPQARRPARARPPLPPALHPPAADRAAAGAPPALLPRLRRLPSPLRLRPARRPAGRGPPGALGHRRAP